MGAKTSTNMTILHLVTAIATVAACTIQSNTEQLTQTYNIDTSVFCNEEDYSSIPICSMETLNRKMRIALRVMRHAINDIATTIQFGSLNCHDYYNLPVVPSPGSDVVATLQTGIQMMTQVALNISVTNCHTRGRCSRDVFQSIVDVICEMKRTLMYVRFDPSIFSATMTCNTMDRTELTVFTCASLGTAVEVLRFLENDINRIFSRNSVSDSLIVN